MKNNSKRILLLADVNSAHTRKWAESLSQKGFLIGIFSLTRSENNWFQQFENISVLSNNKGDLKVFHKPFFKKIVYLKFLPKLKKAIREFKPDILHAHYASSYGLLGMLTTFHPLIISCWGSDVMDFPTRGLIQKFILKNSLKAADKILVTSKTIEKYVRQIIKKEVIITPFGINTEIFKSINIKSVFRDGDIVIGTIKSLEKIYCIDILIEAFATIKKEIHNIKLLIVGEGKQKAELVLLVRKLGIENEVVFTGKIDSSETPKYHNRIDIFVNISEYESFGVSVLEAMACEKPVIVTNTGGLAEIVENDSVGLKIPVKDKEALVSKIKLLIGDQLLRKNIGHYARKLVLEKYNSDESVKKMIAVYNDLLQ